MLNKVITILDINNNHNQYIETLLIASIIEKKYPKINIIDLNLYENNSTLVGKDKAKEKNEIWTAKVFDRCNYMFMSNQADLVLKMQNLAKTIMDKNEILLINPNYTKFDLNTFYIGLADEIILFADIQQDVTNKLLKIIIKHGLNKKRVHIYAYNYVDNMQNQKKYLSLIKQFAANPEIKIDTLESIPNFKDLNELANIDPWTDIYKKINGAF